MLATTKAKECVRVQSTPNAVITVTITVQTSQTQADSRGAEHTRSAIIANSMRTDKVT